jgi:hypothetical protein
MSIMPVSEHLLVNTAEPLIYILLYYYYDSRASHLPSPKPPLALR